jgi:modulator of FtsH protease
MWLAERLGVLAWGTLPFVIGGVSVLVTSGAGLYWIVFGIVGAIVGAVINAWVLLVEILR